MESTQSSGTRPVHQTVASGFEFKSQGKTIAIGFTEQRLSPHAGSAVSWGRLRPLASLKNWGFRAVNGGDRLAITREGLLQVDRLLHEFFKPEHNTGRYA